MPRYFFKFNTQVKERWAGKTILYVMSREFVMKPEEYYIEAIERGVITIDDKKVTKCHVLCVSESIQHLVHYHEPKIPNIEVIRIEKDYLVVNKPPGIACHPTSNYNFFSVTRALESYGSLSCINRLDVLTSGILILAFKNAKHYHMEMVNRRIEKVYVAKVKGHFHDEIVVSDSLKKNHLKITEVCKDGKKSVTRFKRLFFSNNYSLVECRPETGRSHQIRVHLMSIKFPIINDPIYNDSFEEVFNNSFLKENELNKKKNDFGNESSVEERTDKKEAWEIRQDGDMEKDVFKSGCDTVGEHSPEEQFAISHCRGTTTRAFRNKNQFICLHAYKYAFNGQEFTAELPFWAKKENF